MFGFQNDTLFIVKCILAKHGEMFVLFLLVGGMFFFSTLINVSEIGLFLHLNPKTASEDILAESTILISYYNTFWNILISMTTIGYGDMYVRANLSRIIIFFDAIYGAVIFPVMVVTITNLFEINRNERISINIVKMVEKKQILKEKAAQLVPNILKLKKAKKKGDKEEIEFYNNKVVVLSKIFSKHKQAYMNLLSYSEINDLTSKIENINSKFHIL